MIRTLCGLIFLLLGSSVNAYADPFDAHFEGLQKPSCLAFVGTSAAVRRSNQWLAAIDSAYVKYPEETIGWLVGARKPPKTVLAEAKLQQNCLISAMLHDAKKPTSSLVLDYKSTAAKKSDMRKLTLKRAISSMTYSDYRGAKTQGWIWHRKFVFSGRSFNKVSAESAKLCELTTGETWKPAIRKHRKCWSGLDGKKQQLEILLASSAPGISRHHWGTEFDMFSLNPRNFFHGKRFVDEFAWMNTNGMSFGFFQPYTDAVGRTGYMEERWHWSYFPVADALTTFAAKHDAKVEQALFAQWDAMEKKWSSKKGPYFSLVRERWRDYMFGISSP